MTSTGFNIGMESDIRPSSNAMVKPSPSGGGESRDIFGAEGSGLPGHHRVLKPPGGGSSDIFGADGATAQQAPVRRNNRNQSQLQSSMFTDMMETKNKSGKDSHYRLFGAEPPSSAPTPAPAVPKAGDHQARDRRNPINHNGMTEADCSQSFSNNRRVDRRPDGNPVTGEGYAIANGVKEIAATNGSAQSAPVVEAAAPKTNGVKSAPPSRPGRVPPGGFSSGLW